MSRPLCQRRNAFTLLEVMVAVSILAAALLALVSSQSSAVIMTSETERMLTATMLAREKMAEVQVKIEKEGFTDSDIEEEGDFKDFGSEDVTGADLQLDVGESFVEYRWAWTLRQVDISLAGDIGSLGEQLAGSGFWGDQTDETSESSSSTSSSSSITGGLGSTPDLSDMGISGDSLLEQLGNYVREVRVVVWWGDNEEGDDQLELVTHVINPTGSVSSSDTTEETTQ